MASDVKKTNVLKAQVRKPRLERLALMKALMQGFRIRLDEDLLPLGITAAQLRVLWTVEVNPLVSGAEVARLCSVTPQTGHAVMARLEEQGLVLRRPSEKSERVLVAELTAKGRKVLEKASALAEALDRKLWQGIRDEDLNGMEKVLGMAVERLER